MGQFLAHVSQLSEDESEVDLDVFNPNHYDKCVDETNLKIRGQQRIIMSQELCQKILDYSRHEISGWIRRGVGPSSVCRDELLPIQIHLSWILQRNVLKWSTRLVYNEMTKLHPGYFPNYDVPDHEEDPMSSSIMCHNGDDIDIGGPSDWKLTVLMSREFYRVIMKWHEEKLKYWYRCNQTVPIWNFENQNECIIRISLSWILQTDALGWNVDKIHQETGKLFPNVRFLKF